MKKTLASLLLFFNLGFSQDDNSHDFFFIEFSNNKKISTQEIIDYLQIPKKYFLFEEKINIKTINLYKEKLISFYKSQGFYASNINLNCDFDIQTCNFNISEGDELIISNIDYKLSKNDIIEISKLSELKIGERFLDKNYNKTKYLIERHYKNQGYFNVEIQIKPFLNILDKTLKIEVIVNKGEKFKNGEIKILGLDTIKDKYLKKFILIKPNTTYNVKDVENTYTTLLQLENFSEIKIKNSLSKDNIIDYEITLKEIQKTKKTTSIGFDTDEGFKLKYTYLDNNFYGNLKKLKLQTILTGETQEVNAMFSTPLKNDDFVFSNTLLFGNTDKTLYSNRKIENKTVLKMFDNHYIYNIVKKEILDNKEENINEEVTLSKLGYKYVFNNRNDYKNPTSGTYFRGNFEYSNDNIGSDYDFLKSNIFLNYLIPFNNNHLSYKFKLKNIWNEDDPSFPISEKFFLGGSNGNRGMPYEYDSTFYLIEHSMDFNFNLYKDLNLVLFYDYTNDYSNDKDYLSGGFGVRYKTEFGPLKLDIGKQLNENDLNKNDFVFHFSFGATF